MAGQYKYYLLFLVESSDNKQIKLLLQNSSKSQILAIREVTLNVLKSNVPVTAEQKQKLKKHKKFLIKFAEKGITKCVLARHAKIIKYILEIAKKVIREKL